jgi:signal transduction histidine kinase
MYPNIRGGLKLYRNGFRVLPYGEANDDWLNMDRRWSVESGQIGIPFGNRNLFGFVEVIDKESRLFEETASREGLIENKALKELKSFIEKALIKGRATIGASIELRKARQKRIIKKGDTRNIQEKIESIDENVKRLGKDIMDNAVDEMNVLLEQKEQTKKYIYSIESITAELLSLNIDIKEKIEDLAMMRVLAGLGLTIAEFVHELQQFTPSFNGNIHFLAHQNFSDKVKNVIQDMQRSFNRFKTYTSYFDKTISRNVQRELEPINIKSIINEFLDTIQADAQSLEIDLDKEFDGFDLFTCPMHPSEWSTIFFNLYTNSKKAIRKAKVKGKILIKAQEDKNKINVDFLDNGVGIKKEYEEQIFAAFFTTSQPNLNGTNDLTGTGLGLKIVKDIIDAYNGEIYVKSPTKGYSTCIHMDIPKANQQELEKYGY